MMKKIMILVWTILVLCAALCGCSGAVVKDELPLAVEDAAQEDLAKVEVAEVPDDNGEALSAEEIIPAVEKAPVVEVPLREDAEVRHESEAVPMDTIRQEPPSTVDYNYAVTVEEVEVTEETSSSHSEIPSMTVPPKTGYADTTEEVTSVLEVVPVWEVAPSPEPVAPAADLDAVMAVTNAYAASVYGCVIDPTLDMGNSSYRYPAYASADADQAAVEAKARDIVDFTFQQLAQQNGVTLERLIEAGVRCNVYAYRDSDSIFLYCLYA